MARLAPARSNRAFSLLEVIIAASIMTVVMLFVVGAMSTSLDAASFDMASTAITKDLRKSVDRINRDLRDAGGDEFNNNFVTTHAPGAATTVPTVSFRRRTGLNTMDSANVPITVATSAATNWGGIISYQLAAGTNEIQGNAVDDDGDGLIDEQSLTRTEGGVTVMVVDNVLAFTVTRSIGVVPPAPEVNPLTDDELLVTLQVGRGYSSKGVRSILTQQAVTRVTLRNRARLE